jgi:HlyD family secretion protein
MSAPPTTAGEKDNQLERLLGSGGSRFAQYRRWLILVMVLVLLAVLGYFLLAGNDDAAAPRYRTESATVGSLVVKVSATGNLQPTIQVDVGSELSGIIEEVYVKDNDRVKKGQPLARLNLSMLEDAVEKSRANLASAEARVLLAQATAAEARANLSRFREVAELSGGKVPSKSEMDAAEAGLKRAEADEASALAAVLLARATLKSDETNLAKAYIRSPIDGVVLTREVEPGQTVAATFQAPVLFTLAEDLAKMELQVDVDEADVGQVQVGQKATFGVDAWPGRSYAAVITRVGYGSQEKEGVISYPAVLEVDNADLSLRPGMTGTADITTLIRENALLVPNAALRFTPPANDDQPSGRRGPLDALLPRPPRTAKKVQTTAPDAGSTQRLWVLRDGDAVPLQVEVGATNGRVTEIRGGDLQAGEAVITETAGSRR